MTDPIDVSADTLARRVVQAASTAQAEGFWNAPGSASEDAVRHLVRFLGLLVAGDDHIHTREMDVFGRVFASATGDEVSDNVLRASAMSSVEMASDPDALHAFLGETPAYVRAVLEMDRARGTHHADEVIAALGALAVAVLAADGRETLEENSIFTTHLNHLRGELDG